MNEALRKVLEYFWNEKGLHLMTATETMKLEYQEEEWIVEGMVPESGITAISGVPESFKTSLTLELARCVSLGENFLGKFKTAKGKVVIIDKEDGHRYIQKRLGQLGVTANDELIHLTDNDDFYIDDEKYFDSLIDMVSRLGVKLVVFDSLIRMYRGDENESRQIAIVMGRFKKIVSHGASVIFTHHHRKERSGTKKSPNSMRGSSDILAGIDSLFMLENHEDEKYITVEHAKLKQGLKLEPFKVIVEYDKEKDTIKFSHAGEYNPAKKMLDELKNEAVVFMKDRTEATTQDMQNAFSDEYSEATISKALKELVTDGKLSRARGRSNKYTYSLKK